MVRYYGYYSNVARGKWKKLEKDELIPSVLEEDGSLKVRPGATYIPIKNSAPHKNLWGGLG